MQHLIAAMLLLLGATCARAVTPNPPPPLKSGFEDTLCSGMPVRKVAAVDFLAFYDERSDAEAAARSIDAERFAVTVRRSADRPDWVLRAVYRELPTQDQLDADAETLVPRLKASGGRYHGFACESHPFKSSELQARMRAAAQAR